MCMQLCRGVYKQWTGPLEWWDSGMVDWIVLYFVFGIYRSFPIGVYAALWLPSYSTWLMFNLIICS